MNVTTTDKLRVGDEARPAGTKFPFGRVDLVEASLPGTLVVTLHFGDDPGMYGRNHEPVSALWEVAS